MKRTDRVTRENTEDTKIIYSAKIPILCYSSCEMLQNFQKALHFCENDHIKAGSKLLYTAIELQMAQISNTLTHSFKEENHNIVQLPRRKACVYNAHI